MSGKSYKAESVKGNVGNFISEAYGELQGLRDEMREWADNMENGNLGATQKCQDVGACADQLDSVADDEPEVPDDVAGVETSVTDYLKRGQRRGSESRATRCSNACARLSAAVEEAETLIGQLEEEKGEAENDAEERNTATPPDPEGAKVFKQQAEELQTRIEALEEFRDHVQNSLDEAEGAEFPGMY